MKFYYYYDYPIGCLTLAEANGSIVGLHFEESGKTGLLLGFEFGETELLKKAAGQLDEYFAGKRKVFDLPLVFTGTDFQKKVWAALLAIPYGETRSYGEIATSVGNSKAARAVGMANNRNPIAIFCPCHRVIGADGTLVGFGGGLPIKQYLLDLERKNSIKAVGFIF